jgi:hypothetical protein
LKTLLAAGNDSPGVRPLVEKGWRTVGGPA